MRMGFIAHECECDSVSVSAWVNENDTVVSYLGDSLRDNFVQTKSNINCKSIQKLEWLPSL